MEPIVSPSVATTHYAGFWIRAAAHIIDFLIAGAVASILSRMLFDNYNPYFESGKDPGPGGISLLVSWIYFAYQESSVRQATIGKLAVGIKVCSENGERLTFENATGKYFAKILSATILFIGFFMVALNEKNRDWMISLPKL